jgi:hypothetical protein
MRSIALDVHRDFCEVAIAEGGQVRRAGRVETTPATLELFAQSLAADDQVVLQASGNALAIARISEPHVSRVVLGRIWRRAQLVRQRTREKKQVHAILIRNLKQRSPSAVLGDPAVRGRLRAGLTHPRVETEVADQMPRSGNA